MTVSQPGADAMPPRQRLKPLPLPFLFLLLALMLLLSGHAKVPLFAADLRLPHASWSFAMRIGPVQFRTGAFEIGQSVTEQAVEA